MQTVLTHLVLTNAHVKWDTSAMDARVQVVLIFPYFVNRLIILCSVIHACLCTELPRSTYFVTHFVMIRGIT